MRDEHGNVKQDKVHGGDLLWDRVPSNRRSASSMSCKDQADAIALAMSGLGKSRKIRPMRGASIDMAVLRQKAQVHLETDSCGRYNYAKAFMYREVETKQKGTYREQIVGYGVARRQHGDPKDSYVGEGLAVSRALEDLGYKVGRRSWGKVKHNDDIKVQRRQQKKRRQDKAEHERTRYQAFKESMERRLRLTT